MFSYISNKVVTSFFYLGISQLGRLSYYTFIDWFAGAVEDATQHVLWDGHSHDVAAELTGRVLGVNARGAFEDLDDGLVAGNFKDLTGSQLAVGQRQVDDLGVFGEFDVVQDDEWTVDTNNCLVSFLQITKRLVKSLEVTISKGSSGI